MRPEEADVNRSRNGCVSGSMSPKSDERPRGACLTGEA